MRAARAVLPPTVPVAAGAVTTAVLAARAVVARAATSCATCVAAGGLRGLLAPGAALPLPAVAGHDRGCALAPPKVEVPLDIVTAAVVFANQGAQDLRALGVWLGAGCGLEHLIKLGRTEQVRGEKGWEHRHSANTHQRLLVPRETSTASRSHGCECDWVAVYVCVYAPPACCVKNWGRNTIRARERRVSPRR